MDEYYVYVLLDISKPGNFIYDEYKFLYEPFYIGKGKGRRIQEHFFPSYLEKNTNSHKRRRIKKIIKETSDIPTYKKIKEQIYEDKAFELEIKLISIIGRRDLKTGPLVNKTSGGDGLSGFKHSEQSIDKIRKAKVGSKNPFYGKHHSDKNKEEASKLHNGNTHANEWKKEASKRHSK